MANPVIGRYEVRRGLGRGAMGSVYLAFDPKLQREVALKVLQKEFAENPKYRTRFEREARALAALRHPNVVEIYDYGGSPDAYLYLVMEYVRGPHVGRLSRDHHPLPESVIAAIGCELAHALGAAHKAGIIHRDLKPENVFVDRGRLVLGDFGIVKAITADNPFGRAAASPRTDIVGTPGFMAPEQLSGEALDSRADLFALGAMLYYLATLKLPFDADSPYALLKAFQNTHPTPLSVLRGDFSVELCSVIHACLALERDQRPKSAEVLSRSMRHVLNDLGTGDVRETLAGFELGPEAFRVRDRAATASHLVKELKIAVRDQDGIRCDSIRQRLFVLDPLNPEAQRVSGAATLIAMQKPTLRGRTRRLFRRIPRGLRWGSLTALIVGTAFGAAFFAAPPPTPRPTLTLPGATAKAQLTLRASHRTRVTINGRELGETPQLSSALVAPGIVTLEVLHPRFGFLKEQLTVTRTSHMNIYVDWPKRRIDINDAAVIVNDQTLPSLERIR